MARRNPTGEGRPVRRRRALADQMQAGPWRPPWWPSPERIARMRAEVVARRGHSPLAVAAYLRAVKREGSWAWDVDWREAPDEEVVWLWNRHRDDLELGPAPESCDLLVAMYGSLAAAKAALETWPDGAFADRDDEAPPPLADSARDGG